MKFLILLSLLFTFRAFSQSTYLPWWAVSDREMQTANCKTLHTPTVQFLESEILRMGGDQKKDDSVFGVSVEKESPVLIDALKTLTTRTPMYGGSWGKVKEPQIQLQQEFSINPLCNKVMCAVKKIWGDELGLKILWTYLKHGYNSSEYAFDSADRFTLDEIDDVIMTLEDLPSQLVPLAYEKNQRLVPINREQASHAVANSTIILMNTWREKSSMTRQQTLFHELGHNMATRHLDKAAMEEWKDLPDCYVSQYSQESASEHFAESVVAYRYTGQEYKKRCPLNYDFIRTRVFEREYLHENGCETKIKR